MLIITDLLENIVAVWSGNNNTLTSIYPNNPTILQQYNEYHFENDDKDLIDNRHKYKIVNGQYIKKTAEELNPPPTREQKIEKIKTDYETTLEKLIMTKLKLEMLNQPIGSVISAYQTKKAEMEQAIRDVK